MAIESPKSDATQGELDAIKYKALAAEVDVIQKTEAVKQEAQVAQAGAVESSRKQAGKEQEAKLAQGTPEGEFASEAATNATPWVQVAATGLQTLSESANNPAQASDVAKAGIKGTSFEDGFKAMKTANPFSIQTKGGISLFDKAAISKASMKSLVNETTGVKDNGAATAQLQKAGQMQYLVQNQYTHRIANEKVLGQVNAIERNGPVAYAKGPSVGGMGSGGGQQQINAVKAPELALNNMAPKPPSFKDEDDSWVS